MSIRLLIIAVVVFAPIGAGLASRAEGAIIALEAVGATRVSSSMGDSRKATPKHSSERNVDRVLPTDTPQEDDCTSGPPGGGVSSSFFGAAIGPTLCSVPESSVSTALILANAARVSNPAPTGLLEPPK